MCLNPLKQVKILELKIKNKEFIGGLTRLNPLKQVKILELTDPAGMLKGLLVLIP